jgi:hypothetical protein
MGFAIASLFALAAWDASREEAHGLHFPISCSTQSQQLFDVATARLHSLRYEDSENDYAKITAAEPSCAMAYWGVAMSRLKRPIAVVPTPDDIRAGREALRVAAIAGVADARERAYLGAIDLLFREGASADWHERTVAYAHAMETLAAQYKEDREATIFYALALNIAALPSDKSFHNQTKAAELLLVALGEEPDHPGIAHYLTYCLNLPSGSGPDLTVAQKSNSITSVETGLAILALAAVGAFFVAVLPVWSGTLG